MTGHRNEFNEFELISIKEANENANQIIHFCIPITIEESSELSNIKKLNEFLSKEPIEAFIKFDGRPQSVNFNMKNYSELSSVIQGYEIIFKVDQRYNFRKPVINKTSILKFLRSIAASIIFMIAEALGPIIIGNIPKTIPFELPINLSGVNNRYVGNLYKEKYRNIRFIVLQLVSDEILKQLFLKHRIYFVNENGH